jgi:hypothetical protein
MRTTSENFLTQVFTPLHLFPIPQDVGFRVWYWTGAIGRFWPYRTFGYAGSCIWTSENSSSRHLGE